MRYRHNARFRHSKQKGYDTIRLVRAPSLAGRFALVVYLRLWDDKMDKMEHDDVLETLGRVAGGRFKAVYKRSMRWPWDRHLVLIRLKSEKDLIILRLAHAKNIWRVKRVAEAEPIQDDGPDERASSGVS